MDLGNILSKLRKSKGLNQREFANSFGVSNGAVAMWETNKRQPDIDTLIKIANFYNVSLEYLIGVPSTSSDQLSSDLSPIDIELIEYFHETCNSSSLSAKDKDKVINFFPFVTILQPEEKELLEYYNELSLKDRRWIMGQMIDLIKKANEHDSDIPKAQ